MIKKDKPIRGTPLVSSIIAAHDVEHNIENCIDSLMNQSYGPLEIIAVDNCSKDKTYNILQRCKKKYPGLKILQIRGKSIGPGNAWNYGAENARGTILMTLGANFVYGKDYIQTLIQPILKGKTIGTIHKHERILNVDNIWARAFCDKRVNTTKTEKIFGLIRKDAFFKYGPFDSQLRYADDQTIFKKYNFESIVVDAEVWHHNPHNFNRTWAHDVWIGSSFDSSKTVLLIPFFPVWVLLKTIEHLQRDFYWKFIFFLPLFYSLRFLAYLVGGIKRMNKEK